MMKRRWLLRVGMGLLVLLAAAPAIYYLSAKLHGEHFYRGRPTSYWSQEVRHYHNGSWSPPLLDRWLDSLSGRRGRFEPAVFAADSSAIPVLVDLMQDAEPQVSIAAAMFLAGWVRAMDGPEVDGIGWTFDQEQFKPLERVGPETVAMVATGLDHPGAAVREVSACLLGHLGPHARDAVPALVRALQDKDERVRAMAERTLKRIDKAGTAGGKPAAPVMQAALHDHDSLVRETAAEAVLDLVRDADDSDMFLESGKVVTFFMADSPLAHWLSVPAAHPTRGRPWP